MLKGVVWLTGPFFHIQSQLDLLENIHILCGNVYFKFQCSETNIELSVGRFNKGDGEKETPCILQLFLYIKIIGKWYMTYKKVWRRHSSEVGENYKVRKCMENGTSTLCQSSDMSGYENTWLVETNSPINVQAQGCFTDTWKMYCSTLIDNMP
jgi:hypothetical protein